MKNLVCMVNFTKLGQIEQPFVTNTSQVWKKWCDKREIDFLMWETPLYDTTEVVPIVQAYYLPELLKTNNLDYDQIACINYDTFPMPWCPNFFDMTDGKFAAALDTGEPHQLNRSIRMVRENWFPEVKNVSWSNYINAGFIVYNKSHINTLKEIIDFYEKFCKPKTSDGSWCKINKCSDFGDDQTILNFVLRKNNHEITYLPRSFNVMDHFMRLIFFHGEDSAGRFIDNLKTIKDCVDLFHFTGDNTVRNQLTTYLFNVFYNQY